MIYFIKGSIVLALESEASVWAEFNKSLKEIENLREKHRAESALVIADIETQIKGAGTTYSKESQNVREWVDSVESKLSIYMHTRMKTTTQLKIIVKSLTDGLTKLNEAQQHLDKSLMDFNPLALNMQTSITQYDREFKEKDRSFRSKLKIMRASNGKGAYDKVEKVLIPKVLDQIDFYEINFRKVLTKKTQQLSKNIDSVKAKLRGELQIIGEIKAKVEPVVSEISIIYPISQPNAERTIKELIQTCQKYQKTKN